MGDNYPRFRVAAVQAASVMFDREKTIAKAIRFIEEAADKGAAVIGFPELFVPGHTNVWYAAKQSNPLKAQAAMFRELVGNSVQVPGEATDRLCAAARRAHACVVIGITEHDALYSGTLYLSQLFISGSGEIMGVHRKLVMTASEKLVYSCGDGSTFNVYDTPHARLSGLNCGEHSHDLFKHALLAMGSQVHVAAWPSFPARLFPPDQGESVQFRARQFAHAGQVFVIQACGVTDIQNIEACCDSEEEKAAIDADSGGGSAIIGPNGAYLAGPLYRGEGVVVADISLEDALRGRQFQNLMGHYTRWDVVSLNFNRGKLSPFGSEAGSATTAAGLAEEVARTNRALRSIGERLDRLLGEEKG